MTQRNLPWIVLAVSWGVGAGLWQPRGPLTAAQALWSVGLSAAVGALAGWASRSRWAMLAAPAVFVAALELARVRLHGPSVDGPHASTFGVAAQIAGRGVQGVLSVLPMMVAAAYGAALGRRGRPPGKRIPRYLRRTGVGALAAVVALATAAAVLPARTAAIPGGVAELTTVDGLGLMIRGRDTSAPVLLYVPGAPGGMEMGSVRRHLGALEEHFVVVTLDRRGGGKSYGALDGGPPAGLDSGVADTIAVTNYLRARFRQDRIYLLAHSGGSLLGALAAARHPELYRAYIGVGQAVDLPETDRIFYADILAWARATGKRDLERTLVDRGPPPYPDFFSYEPIITNTAGVYGDDNAAAGMADNLATPEYTVLEKAHTLNSMMDSWQAQYPDLQRIDLRTDVPRLRVPAYFMQGAHEMRGLAVPFAQWFGLLDAPVKRLVVFETSGHRPMFEQPDRFVDAMAQVRADTA
ncbi:alpha/beta hydrolase [Asanoa sp. NPDC049573]|uniref:alpha/beta fold hydrolase n=1 Tax=Asanoa sp. NPDC049573 TaxID=3155396 RepID=UPI00342CE304